MKFAIVPVAAAAIALAMTPAMAKSKKHHARGQHQMSYQDNGWQGGQRNSGWQGGYQGQGWRGQGWQRGYANNGWGGGGWNQGGWGGGGFATRNVSDPSYQSPGFRRNQALGRCVEDLGYGRYEYCGW